MPRRCTICTHPDRMEIDAAIVRQEPFRRVAEHYALAPTSLRRHSTTHLAVRLAQARQAQQAHELATAEDLLTEAQTLHAMTRVVLEEAGRTGQLSVMLSAIREGRANLVHLGKLLIPPEDHPGLQRLRAEKEQSLRIIREVFAQHPEVHQEVLAALSKESG
jgi:hypothetical protein